MAVPSVCAAVGARFLRAFQSDRPRQLRRKLRPTRRSFARIDEVVARHLRKVGRAIRHSIATIAPVRLDKVQDVGTDADEPNGVFIRPFNYTT